MGFDLYATDKAAGKSGYFRAGMREMILLRSAMIAAGVDRKLVYGKFIGNDGLRVTAIESRHIAANLRNWLKGRSLIIDLYERNETARRVTRFLFDLSIQLGDRNAKDARNILNTTKSLPVKVSAGMRKAFLEFANFCGRSRGFKVC